MAPPRTASVRAPLVAAAALVLALLVGGCATLLDVDDLRKDLTEEGFDDVSTTVEPGTPSVLVVDADAPAGASVEEAHDQAAELVWEQFPRRFDALRITIDGEAQRYTYDELETELGPRDESLDAGGDVSDNIERAGVVTLVVVTAGGLLVVLFLALLTVILIRRSRRRVRPLPPLRPWAPPAGSTPTAPSSALGAPSAPVPPSGGWGAGPTTSAPGAPPPTPITPRPLWTPPPARVKVDLRKRPVETAADRRRLGRRPRGPMPDVAHTPPGWD